MNPLNKPRPFAELQGALRELADISLSRATLYRLARQGDIPVTVVGGRKRSTVAAVVAALTPEAKASA